MRKDLFTNWLSVRFGSKNAFITLFSISSVFQLQLIESCLKSYAKATKDILRPDEVIISFIENIRSIIKSFTPSETTWDYLYNRLAESYIGTDMTEMDILEVAGEVLGERK